VLSTPPAFVLSQDQTLQQRKFEKSWHDQISYQRNQPKRGSKNNKNFGTGINKHPVKFSKNKHTPNQTTHRATQSGATPQHYPIGPIWSNPAL
jgi:hypothetical protein